MGSHTPIAVVGMGCVVPGASSIAAFQSNILAGRDVTRTVPAGRWILNPRHALADDVEEDSVYSLRGCFVEDFALDPRGLALDPKMLTGLDPLYQLVLHAGRDAFLDGMTAGLDRDRVNVDLANDINSVALACAEIDCRARSSPAVIPSKNASRPAWRTS